jgi:predicted transcriptional regulator
LLREAWRQYFDSRYGTYTPTKAELAAIKRGRAAIARGEFVTLSQLHHELDAARHQPSKKGTRKTAKA